jgi:hypothetical protein
MHMFGCSLLDLFEVGQLDHLWSTMNVAVMCVRSGASLFWLPTNTPLPDATVKFELQLSP